MITIEMLNQSESLKGLTDAQKQAITTLSSNDEATVIGTKIGALHGQYDADILSISGISKADGEKTYDYLKRVLGDYKTKLDGTKTLSAQLEAQKNKVTELETKLAAGGSDEAVKQQLKDARHQVTQLQTQLTAKTGELDKAKKDYEKKEKDLQVSFAFTNATAGIKFKADVSEPVKKILLAAAKDEILAKGTPDFIDDGNGGKKLVLRDAAGNTLNNPKNNLNPYTIEELVMETSLKDVIDTGKQQPGGGTNPNPQSDHRTVNLDLSTAKTQQEADVQIENYLLSTGLTRDNVEFGNKALEIRNENNVSSLPIR
jgi:preprotein translocase subunit SecD|nr:MAG TPA: minor structural protein [Caudoviricetes sp.]